MGNSGKNIVYILDDDDAVRDSTAFLLEANGIAAQTFGSPREFLRTFDPEQAACLLLDHHMPEMTGLEVLKQLRSRGIGTPVIVFSGRSDSQLDELFMECGVEATLHKPANDELLITTIQQAIAKAGKS